MDSDPGPALPPLPFPCHEVPAIAASDRAGFHAAVAAGEATVIRGMVADWPLTKAMRELPTDRARVRELRRRSRIGAALFAQNPPGYLHYTSDYTRQAWSFRLSTFGRFARRLEACLDTADGPIVYMQALPIRLLPGLRRGIRPIVGLGHAFRPPCAAGFWIGSGRHVVNSHFDFKNNLICMISGVKRLVVAPPAVIPYMHWAAVDRGIAGTISSLARLLELDFARFPRLANALSMLRVAVLDPGDALYVPPCWMHHVESFGVNVMVNAWRDALPREVEARWYRSLLQSISHLSEREGTEKEVLRARLLGARDIPTASIDPELVAHVDRVADAYRQAGDAFREVGELLHDYYVFDRCGPPVTLPPGERERMVQRVRRGLDARVAPPPLRDRVKAAPARLWRRAWYVHDWPAAEAKVERRAALREPYERERPR